MPTTGTINTQQILQMGTHAEKLQHTIQHLPSTTAQQVQDDQISINELKQIEVQDPEKIEPSEPTYPEGKRRRDFRLRNKSTQNDDNKESHTHFTQNNPSKVDSHQGQKIDLTV